MIRLYIHQPITNSPFVLRNSPPSKQSIPAGSQRPPPTMQRSVRRKTPHNVRPEVQRHVLCLFFSANAPPETSLSKVRRPNTASAPHEQKNSSDANDDKKPIIDLDDHKKFYSSFSTGKLLKSWLTLHAAARKPTADLGSWVMRSGAMNGAVMKWMVLRFTERTFFDHFCGGRDLSEAGRTVRKLRESGMNAMLDYGLEHSYDDVSCERNVSDFIRSIEWAKELDSGSVSFVVVKITAICPPGLLRRVSDLLRWEYRNSSNIHVPWKLRTLPIFTEKSALYHTVTMPAPLNRVEEHDLEIAYKRLDKICQKSVEANVPILIDAEDTSIQPAIDYLTYATAIKCSMGDKEPLIFNTIQAYLRDAKERLVNAKRAADEMRVPVGFKLVRGAYMLSEMDLVKQTGAVSPIHEGIQMTHECYNACAEFMLHEIANRKGSVVIATHNIESGKLAAAKASDLGIKREDPHLQFAQLYGMSEALSFGLKDAGFKVSKYLPFGPVEQIMPYLLRRAEENRGLLSTSSLDRELMRKELGRRLKSRLSWNDLDWSKWNMLKLA